MKFPLLAGFVGAAWCADNDIKGPGNLVLNGKGNKIQGKDNTVDGWKNKVNGNFNDIQGDKNDVEGNSNLVDGNGNMVIGSGNIVMGGGNFVHDDLTVNVDKNWEKHPQSQQPFPSMPLNPLFGGMNMAMMMNQNMGPQFHQTMMEKMKKDMDSLFDQMGMGHNRRNPKKNAGSGQKEI